MIVLKSLSATAQRDALLSSCAPSVSIHTGLLLAALSPPSVRVEPMHSKHVCLNLCRGLVGRSKPPSSSARARLSGTRFSYLRVKQQPGCASVTLSQGRDLGPPRGLRRRYVFIVKGGPCDATGDGVTPRASAWSRAFTQTLLSLLFLLLLLLLLLRRRRLIPSQVKKQLVILFAVSGSFSYSWNTMKRRGESWRVAPSAQELTQCWRWQLHALARRRT